MLLLLLSTLGGYLVVCSAENSTVPTAGTGPSTSSSSMETPAVSVPTTTTDIIVVDCYGAARLSACFVPNSCVVGKCFNGECERIDPYETNLGVECARYKDALARRRTTSEPLGAANTTAASSGSGTVTAIALSVVAGLVAILAFVCAIIWWSRTRSADLITPRDSKASVLPLTSSPPPRKEGTRLSFRGVARGLPLPVGAAKREPIAVKDDAEWAPPAVEDTVVVVPPDSRAPPARLRHDATLQDNFTHGKRVENREKNRYRDILPYDYSRVLLRPNRQVPGSDYINASYIKGYGNQTYIAAQGPTEATTEDFWRMIWETHAPIVVMLTKLRERGREKVFSYWPDDIHHTKQYGNVIVTNNHVSETRDYVLRKFTIRCTSNQTTRPLYHMQYCSWPDHGSPEETESFLGFIDKMETLEVDDGCRVVHCSAGVGRSGSYIAIQTQLHRFANEGSINVLECVEQMRSQRPNMVQSPSQYQFVHRVLLDGIQRNHGATRVLGLEPRIRAYVEGLLPGTCGPADFGRGGRQVLAVGHFLRLQRSPEEGRGYTQQPVVVVLFNDVLAIATAPDEQGNLMLLNKLADRAQCTAQDRQVEWDEPLIALHLGPQRSFLLEARTVGDKSKWVNLVNDQVGYASPDSLFGPRLIASGPRSKGEIAEMLGINDPFTHEGAQALEKQFEVIPSVFLTTLEVQRGSQLKALPPAARGRSNVDEEGYLIYTPPADDDGTTALIEDIRRLARETHGLEQVNGVREDMLEIEYLVRQLDLQEEHDNVRLLAQRARELEVEAMLARQEAEFQPHGVSSSPARDTDVDAYTEVSMTDYPETEGYPSEEEGQESMAQLTARINSLANAVDPERLAAREAPKERSSVAGFNLLAAHAMNRRNSILRSKGMGGITPGDTASETEEADHQPSKASSVAPASPPTQGRQPSSEGNPGLGRASSGTSRGGAVVSRMSKERRDALSNKMRVAVKMSVGAFQLNKGAAKRMAKASMADSRRQGAQRQQREAVQSDKPKTNVRAHSESLLGQTRFQ